MQGKSVDDSGFVVPGHPDKNRTTSVGSKLVGEFNHGPRPACLNDHIRQSSGKGLANFVSEVRSICLEDLGRAEIQGNLKSRSDEIDTYDRVCTSSACCFYGK